MGTGDLGTKYQIKIQGGVSGVTREMNNKSLLLWHFYRKSCSKDSFQDMAHL